MKKDCGISWLVLAAAFVIQAIVFGVILCFGIYVVVLIEHFGCHRVEAALVGSLAYGFQMLTGPLASILYRKFGCRVVIICGALLAAAGLLLSSVANSIHYLYFSHGLLTGVGLGLVYSPTVGILPDYFDKWKYFATAFVSVGSALGTLLFSPIFLWLINRYDWNGSLVINAGLVLQIVVLGSLLKSRSHQNFSLNANSNLFETSLFKEVQFYLLAISSFFWSGAIFIIFSMINNLVISHGLSKAESTWLVSVIGCANIAGRASSSVIGHQKCTNRVVYYSTAILIYCIAIFATTYCFRFVTFAFSVGVFGFTFGSMLAQAPGIVMDCFGLDRFISCVGYMLFACGFGALTLTPMAGSIADAYPPADSAFYFASCCALLSSICGFSIAFVRCHQDSLYYYEEQCAAVAQCKARPLPLVTAVQLANSNNGRQPEVIFEESETPGQSVLTLTAD